MGSAGLREDNNRNSLRIPIQQQLGSAGLRERIREGFVDDTKCRDEYDNYDKYNKYDKYDK